MSKRKSKIKVTSIIAEELKAAFAPQQPVVVAPPAPPPVVVAPPLTNHVIFILDYSPSMRGCYREAVRQMNRQFALVREKAQQFNQRTTVSLYLFSTSIRCVLFQQPVETLRDLDDSMPYDSNGTALLDAVGTAAEQALGKPLSSDPNTSYLVICATDGEENSSRIYHRARVQDLIRTTQGTDRWTYAFMVPPGWKGMTMQVLGLHEGNVVEWENTTYGAQHVAVRTNAGIGSFYQSRSVGMKSVKNFYTPDLSKFTSTDLAKMTDVSGRFKKWEVSKESPIKEFVEGHGVAFVIGGGYYPLTKKEQLRAGRQVLVQEKGSTRLYGGADARKILGIPDGEVFLNPGNHGNYDIYLQSTSINRVLVRGTKLFYDLLQQPGMIAETWDSAKAKAEADAKAAAQGQPRTI